MRKTISFLLLIALLFTPLSSAIAADSWGLSFQSPGDTPVGNETAEYLLDFSAYYHGDTDEKIIYLTFDAGYENGYTAGILDVLQKTETPAAFFLLGTYIRDYPELIMRMVNEGHTVSNHSMNHPDMTSVSAERFQDELHEPEGIFKEITGQEMPKFYRPPSGKYSTTNLETLEEMGYVTLFWSLAYVDWYDNDQPTKDQAFSKLIPRIHPGAILLLHNTSQTNAEILEELIAEYKSMGYRFGCVTDFAP